MKELLAVISLLLSGAVAEAPAPYPPSGFRPNGPAFELPQKVSQSQNNNQNYLPPVDPRIPSTQYGFPEEDVSVQGLPVMEQRPVFQGSPINGQQYVGPDFNSDIKSLDESYRQRQYQLQQEQYREFERQRQLEAAQARTRPSQQTPTIPRQFSSDTTTETTTKADEGTEATTESDLNEGEVENKKVTVEVSKQKIQEYPGELFLSALSQLQLQPQFVPFGQIRAPLYFQPLQEPSQKQVAGFDAATHFAALPSVLAQQQYLQQIQTQGLVNPALQQVVVSGQEPVGLVAQTSQAFPGQYQPVQAQISPNTYQPLPQNPQVVAANPDAEQNDEQKNDEEPQFVYQQSYQPQGVYQAPQAQYQPQGFQPQGVIYQAPAQQAPVNQYQPQVQEQQNVLYQAPQVQYQPQEQAFIPQGQQAFAPQVQQAFVPQNQQAFTPQGQQAFAPQPQQAFAPQSQQAFAPQSQEAFAPQGQQAFAPQNQQAFIPQGQQAFLPQQQNFLPQAQLVNYPLIQQYQNGLLQQQMFSNQQAPQTASQPDALQSGLDVNQQGNGLEQNEDEEDNNQDDGATSVAVATAFGTRTQPRTFTRYGAPAPLPRASANPQPTTEAAEQATESSGAVAEANAFAGRRKGARLRSRKVRPLFTLDRSGHLVLAQEQN